MRRPLLLLLAGLTTAAHAWIDTGHMLISEVAWRSMTPVAKKEVERLLKIGATDRATDFWSAAAWADDVRSDVNGHWHFINYHFREDGKPSANRPRDENVVWAIRRFTGRVADRRLPDAERADALRFLIHFVGDAHQPLHTTARDTDRTPTGDRGGNDFPIEPPDSMANQPRPPRNLHFLWDLGGGFLPRLNRPLDAEGRRWVERTADSLIKRFPMGRFRELREMDPDRWAREGLAIAKRDIYRTPEGGKPNAAYLQKTADISAERLTLAGYRLARLLNQTLK